MTKSLALHLDRTARVPLGEQIRQGIAQAIDSGVLAPGARLPSWQDLAAQLGVARGTVRVAYEKLAAAQLIVASRATGTRIAARPMTRALADRKPDPGSFMETYREMTAGPAIFQMGIAGQDALPAKLLARIRARAVRDETSAAPLYPDPRGELDLRREIATYLAIARGIDCSPGQILITGGFSAGLGLALRVLGLEGRKAWFEDPGFPFTRHALDLARLSLVPVPVDGDGIDVGDGLRQAPDAALAIVTPGQQAPLGVTLSLARRLALLDWAAEADAWIIEDDYLSELQLKGRAAPALASLDREGRVIHIGSFSKTISPALRLGFIVAPPSLVGHFGEVAACLAPPPGPAAQIAIAAFMRDGHYLRHLRRLKRSYAAQRDALLQQLEPRGRDFTIATAGLAVSLQLPTAVSDLAIIREMLPFGLTPAPLSIWYASPPAAKSGLLLGIATSPIRHVARSCERLLSVIDRFI
ncbi:MocR-like pyridoxine biosynthesis transcription factor PdxR [Dongia rigui]|uniref:PLP-dependent aminotransferase family protein n=1 Tax=Dongia rigui TaxID=940149 RepID=A0ABU5DYY8_9PROT|nr:PLP-dependent aminotransferase family protein [Dongia rigui]MDY0872135.1 PLP-dependent aminotransferase family protein [Dongia rigui]